MDSDSDSSIELDDILGLPSGFEMQPDSDTDEEVAPVESGPDFTEPLFALSRVEYFVIDGDYVALESLLVKALETVQVKEMQEHPVTILQLEVLKLAINVAKADFVTAIQSPLVAGFIQPELASDYSVSRVKARMNKYVHGQLIQHVEKGCGTHCGDPKFKDAFTASPDTHVSQNTLRAASCMYLGAACLGMFMQANYTGPAILPTELDTIYPLPFAASAYKSEAAKTSKFVQDTLSALDADAKAASAISGKASIVEDKFPELSAQCAFLLAANGETIYSDAKLLHFLHVARVIFRSMRDITMIPGTVDPSDMLEEARLESLGESDGRPTNLNEVKPKEKVSVSVRSAISKLCTSGWWCIRSTACHQESLQDSSVAAPSLQFECERGFKHALKHAENFGSSELVARLWLEVAVARHKFKEPEMAKVAFESSRVSAGLNVCLSGSLGRRTKYQDSRAQLLVVASSDTTTIREVSPSSLGISTVKLEELDADTPLHENIQYDAVDDKKDELGRTGKLSLLDQSIILGLCIDVKNSYAMEGLTAEEMIAYVERVSQAADNWMIYSTALLLKSQLEFERTKTKERAVLQMQVLVDQQSDRLTPLQSRQREVDDAAPARDRFLWLHALAWPALWDLKRGLANKYLELGVAGSALKIFEEVKMWDEAADCLVLMDKRHRAEMLIRERLDVQPTANLMCTLGSLLQDSKWFEKAWEFSGKRYSRAKRLWAVDAFGKGDFNESIRHLQDALAINPLYPGSWFRLGSAAMRISDYKLAKSAFANVTSQNAEDGDAWANFATVLSNLNESEAALNAVSQAIKYSSINWKIWENYIFLSLQAKQWGMVIHGISNMIDLRKGSSADMQVDVHALLLVVDHVITVRKEDDTSDLMLQSLRSQLELLFAKIKEHVPSSANIWKVLSMYYGHFDQHEEYRSSLMKRMRALLHNNESWQRNEPAAEKVMKSVADLHIRYTADMEKDTALDEEGRRQVKRQADAIVESVVEQYCAGTLPDEAVTPLRKLLS